MSSIFQTKERILLSSEQLEDLCHAVDARINALAGKSRFMVGVCIRTKDGKTWKGWNVENNIYVVLHAEINAHGSIPKESRDSGIERITIVGGVEGEEKDDICSMCGLCRQHLLDNISDNPEVVFAGMTGAVKITRLNELLPGAFEL